MYLIKYAQDYLIVATNILCPLYAKYV